MSHYTDLKILIEEGIKVGLFEIENGIVKFTSVFKDFVEWSGGALSLDVVIIDTTGKEFTEWVKNWNNKFPTPSVTGARNLRSGVSGKYGVASKMKIFIEEHPTYTLDLIDRATDEYLLREQARGFKYTKASGNFISKSGEPSVLEAECELLINDDNDKVEWNKLG